jgi:hypothetical protein
MTTRTRYLLAIASLVLCLVMGSVATASPPDRRFAVTYAHVVNGTAGRYLVVRVKGPAKRVRIRVTLFRQKRVERVARRWVRANVRLRVPRLSIPTRITTVRIRIEGHVA